MTSRERLLAALNGKMTDQVPYAPLLTPYYYAALNDPAMNDIVSVSRYIGSDILERHSPCVETVYHSAEVKSEDVNGVNRTTISNRFGSVVQETLWKDGTTHSFKRFVKTVEDLKVLTDVYANIEYRPAYELFEQEEKRIGDAGIATADGPMSPLLYLIQHLSTLEETIFLLYDETDAVEEFFNAVHQGNIKYYKLIRDMKLNCVIPYEDTSTTLISRDWMQKYALPALNEYADILRGGPNHFIVHMCGKLQGFKDDIKTLNCDGFDSLCPPLTGDTCIWTAQESWAGKRLIGGIDPVAWKYKSPREILEIVKSILLNLKVKTGFILCSGDSVAAGTPLKNMKVIADFLRLGGQEFLKTEVSEACIDECIEKALMLNN